MTTYFMSYSRFIEGDPYRRSSDDVVETWFEAIDERILELVNVANAKSKILTIHALTESTIPDNFSDA